MNSSNSPAAEPLFTPRFRLACAMHFCGAMAGSLYILFPLFIRHLGGSELTIGLYAGIAGAAAVLARLPVGRLLDTQGRRRVLIGAGLLMVGAWLSFLFIDALGWVAVMLVIAYGGAGGSLFAAYFTYASDIIPVSRRSEGFAMFGIWGMLPNGLGPALGEFLINRNGFGAYFLVAAFFAVSALALSALLPETAGRAHPDAPAAAGVPARFPWRALLSVLATTFMFGVAVESLFVFLAPFSYANGRGSVGSFFITYAGAAVAIRVLSGRLADRIGLRRVLVPALFLYACGVLLVPHSTATTLIFIGVMCGAGHGYAFPIFSALAVEQVSAAHRGRAVSWLTAMFDLGNTLANPLLGGVAQVFGYTAMFTTSGIALLVTAVITWWRSRVA